MKQDIYGWAVAVIEGIGIELYIIPSPAPSQNHVLVAWCDQCAAPQNSVVMGSFLDGNLADAVKALRKRSGE